jgi:putative SOS response-associated peptidase YedK
MCGRYSLLCIDDLGNRFRVHNPMIGTRSRFNIAPGTRQPVIIWGEGGREMVQMQWGLRSPAGPGPAADRPIINARAETLREKPSFHSLLAGNRCLIPASGFFEWKQERRGKTPFYFHLPDKPVFSFAGLYTEGIDLRGGVTGGFAIVTTEPNSLVATVHDRMPVILTPENEERWLADVSVRAGFLDEVLTPSPAGEMQMYPVPDPVNNPAMDNEWVVRPLSSSAGMQTFLPE